MSTHNNSAARPRIVTLVQRRDPVLEAELRAAGNEQAAEEAERRRVRDLEASFNTIPQLPPGSRAFTTKHGPIVLSASELAECKRAGARPEVYAANKAALARRKAGTR